MENILRTWTALTMMKRIVLVVVVVATVGLMSLLTQMAQRPSLALLYAGLDEKAAGAVIVQLDQMGIQNEIRGAGIYVPESDRDRVRMALAANGLPAAGQQGYELLDNLSGFGTTAEMFDAAYWRAKEGELARTLLAGQGISEARVHIGAPRRRTFSRNTIVPTASITLTGSNGRVNKTTATAARYLVANAIPGMEPEQVAVIDSAGGVILKPGDANELKAGTSDTDRAARMKAEIEDILSARVGDGRARVSVNLETTREAKTISRRVIDPDSRILRRSETTELSQSGEDSGSAVTIASNLPDGDAKGGESSSQREEARKTNQYDYTETREEIILPAGTIKKISVAILIDEIRNADENGNVTTENRSGAEITALEKLVKSTIGFDEERGDSVTLESISFVALPQDQGTVATIEELPSFVEKNMMQLIQLGALSFVILVLGLFVVRPIMAGRTTGGASGTDFAGLEDDDPAMAAIDVTPPMGGGDDGGFEIMIADPSESMSGPDPRDTLRNAIGDQTDESVNVLKGWLETDSDQENKAA